MSIIETIKKNTLLKIVLLIVAAYIVINIFNSFFGLRTLSLEIPEASRSRTGTSQGVNLAPGSLEGFGSRGIANPPLRTSQDYTPQPDVTDRLVIQESSLSLLVKDVVDNRNKIVNFAQQNGGYMVTSQTKSPEDAPTATVVVRIPTDKLDEALQFYRSLAVKVVSENLLGTDVTDQYIDIETRIQRLEKTKARIEGILDQATQIQEITSLTKEVINTQNQIDQLKGQQQSLEQNAKLAKLTIYLSTDEIALPYAPSETFRPAVIFKLAVRSLVGTLRKLATLAIWVVVYSVVWVPALGIYIGVRKWRAKRKKPESKQPQT